MLGKLKLPLFFGKHYEVAGGPFREVPRTMVGVKMAQEIDHPFDISIPTRDFDVPQKDQLDAGLREAVEHIIKGDPVYVGCMAGRGRTGLFMAILAKAFGIENPVEYVRETYYEHAVETNAQYGFVTQYEIPSDVRWEIKAAKWWGMFNFKSNLTKTERA